jgi:transposase
VQQRLDANPEAMRQRRETVEHPFGTMKARMGATHFLTKTLPKVAAEMALSVQAYNLTRVINISGSSGVSAARALCRRISAQPMCAGAYGLAQHSGQNSLPPSSKGAAKS